MKLLKRIYIASCIQNRFYAECAGHVLYNELNKSKKIKVAINSTWIYDLRPIFDICERAEIDFGDIDNSDLVVAIYPYGKNGTICEMTYSFVKGTPVIYCYNPTNTKDLPLIVGRFTEESRGYTALNVNSMIEQAKDILGF